MKFKSIADLQLLIYNEIEETTELEYKSSFAIENPKWKEELAKDVSAMANANGGVIIYGIREKEESNGHSVPGEILPISYNEMSKDKLSQLLTSNIRPIIEGVEITVVPYEDNSGCFIVEVPQSNTVHQNRLTHLYYKRRNATIEVMEDYEFRDVMNRSKHPVIELEFELQKTITNITKKSLQIPILGNQPKDEHSTEIEFRLNYRPINKGKIYANYINYFIHIPLELLIDTEREYVAIDSENNYFTVFGDNTTRDLIAVHGLSREYGSSRYEPLLPSVKGGVDSIAIKCSNIEDIYALPPLRYSILADNAPEHIVNINWSDIKLVEKTKSITEDPFPSPNIY